MNLVVKVFVPVRLQTSFNKFNLKGSSNSQTLSPASSTMPLLCAPKVPLAAPCCHSERCISQR